MLFEQDHNEGEKFDINLYFKPINDYAFTLKIKANQNIFGFKHSEPFMWYGFYNDLSFQIQMIYEKPLFDYVYSYNELGCKLTDKARQYVAKILKVYMDGIVPTLQSEWSRFSFDD